MKFLYLSVLVGCALAAPLVGAEGAPPQPEPDQVPKAAKKSPVFTILEYEIAGNTLLSETDIDHLLEPFLGENQTITKIEQAAKGLERLYRTKGYPTVFVNIPEQDIRGGLVRLEVVEGKVQRMRITGANHYLLSDIRKGVPSIKEGETLNLPQFQQDLAKVNARSQHLRVTPVLKPGKYPGSVEVELKVKDELPVVAQLALNNHNSANTTASRLEFNAAYNNLWQRDHGISVQMQTSPENTDEVAVLGLTYLLPGIDDAHRVAVYGVKSDSQVASLGGQSAFTALGKGNILGLRYIVPLVSTSSYLHSVSFGFDYKDFTNTIEIAATSPSDQSISQNLAPITYGAWGADYDVTRPSARGSDRFSVGVHFGLRGLNDDKEFTAKRPGAEPNYSVLVAGVKSQREFWQGWQLRGQLKTQLTDGMLIGNEQLASGGYDSVRGYYQSETMGDQGINGSLELRTPSLFKGKFTRLNDWRFLVFADAGHVTITNPSAGQIDQFNPSSAGFGMRLRAFKQFSMGADFAQALQDGSQTQAGDTRVDADMRWEF